MRGVANWSEVRGLTPSTANTANQMPRRRVITITGRVNAVRGRSMNDDAPVLIVDDDDAVRGVFRRVLERAGWTVLEAANGSAGLALCRAHEPGLVLLDLRMPEMDGLEVLTRIVSEHPETPVIMITGQGTMTDAVEA